MELIDNRDKTFKGDFEKELRSGSKLAIAVSCFSIYAFVALEKVDTEWEKKNE